MVSGTPYLVRGLAYLQAGPDLQGGADLNRGLALIGGLLFITLLTRISAFGINTIPQQTWYCLCRTYDMDCYSRVNFIYFAGAKSNLRFEMSTYPLLYVQRFSIPGVNQYGSEWSRSSAKCSELQTQHPYAPYIMGHYGLDVVCWFTSHDW